MSAKAHCLPLILQRTGRKNARSARGFTIIEVVMASFVLIFGICSAILTLKSGFNAIDAARDTTLASQIIQSEMERIRLLPWSTDTTYVVTDPITGTQTTVVKPSIYGTLKNGDLVGGLPSKAKLDIGTIFPSGTLTTTLGKEFSAIRTVEDVSGKVGEMKTITITVTWKSMDGTIHNRKSSTQYSKSGLYDYYYTKAGGKA